MVKSFFVSEEMFTMFFYFCVKSNRLGAHAWLKDEEHYTYKRKGGYKKNNIAYYICTEQMERFCKARADYDCVNDRVDRFKGEHTHAPNPQKLRAQLEEVNMVQSCSTQLLKPQQVLFKVYHNLDAGNHGDALPYVSSKECLRAKTRQ